MFGVFSPIIPNGDDDLQFAVAIQIVDHDEFGAAGMPFILIQKAWTQKGPLPYRFVPLEVESFQHELFCSLRLVTDNQGLGLAVAVKVADVRGLQGPRPQVKPPSLAARRDVECHQRRAHSEYHQIANIEADHFGLAEPFDGVEVIRVESWNVDRRSPD